jgi:hypothetical protein
MVRATLTLWLTFTLFLAACAELSPEGRSTIRSALDDQEKMADVFVAIGVMTRDQRSEFLRRIGSARAEVQRDEVKGTVDRWLDIGLSVASTIALMKGAKPVARGIGKIGGAIRNASSRSPSTGGAA